MISKKYLFLIFIMYAPSFCGREIQSPRTPPRKIEKFPDQRLCTMQADAKEDCDKGEEGFKELDTLLPIPGVQELVVQYAEPTRCAQLATFRGGNNGGINLERLTKTTFASHALFFPPDGSIRVWDIDKPARQERVAKLHRDSKKIKRERPIACMKRVNDTTLVSVYEQAKKIRMWDVSKEKGKQCVAILEGHKDPVYRLELLDEDTLVSGAKDGIIVWDLKTKTKQRELNEGQSAGCITKLNEHSFATGDAKGRVKVWDLTKAKGKECTSMKHVCTDAIFKLKRLSNTRFLTLHDDAAILPTRSIYWNTTLRDGYEQDGAAEIIDAETLNDNNLATIGERNRNKIRIHGNGTSRFLQGHTNHVNCLQRLDDHTVVSGSSDHTVRMWDIRRPAGKECIDVLHGHKDPVAQIMDLDENTFASGDSSNKIFVWRRNVPSRLGMAWQEYQRRRTPDHGACFSSKYGTGKSTCVRSENKKESPPHEPYDIKYWRRNRCSQFFTHMYVDLRRIANSVLFGMVAGLGIFGVMG